MSALERVELESRGDMLVARVSGEVDLSNAASVTDRLVDATPNSASALVLDLYGTRYLDSSGVRMLFELAHRLRNRGQKLQLVVPDDSNVKRVLLMTEVERVVPMSASVEAFAGDNP
jgi:stage II sporulation protein AA (anti-sigma F factor antagonist)